MTIGLGSRPSASLGLSVMTVNCAPLAFTSSPHVRICHVVISTPLVTIKNAVIFPRLGLVFDKTAQGGLSHLIKWVVQHFASNGCGGGRGYLSVLQLLISLLSLSLDGKRSVPSGRTPLD